MGNWTSSSNDNNNVNSSSSNVDVDDDAVQTKKEAPPSISYRARLRGEWSLPFFGVTEVDDRTKIDVEASFNPKPLLFTFLVKFLIFGGCTAVAVLDVLDTEKNNRAYYLIYLTHWSFLAALLYFGCSFVLTLCGIPRQPYGGNDDGRPSFLVRFTWGLFSVAATAQFAVTILYWTLDYQAGDTIDFLNIFKHGGIMALVLLEGLVVNCVPVRIKHVLFVMMYSVMYLVWSILHWVFDVGNPNSMDEDPTTNDDAIYDVLSWEDDRRTAIIVSVLTVFVAMPLLFWLLWTLSLWSFCCRLDGSNRRYLPKEDDDDAKSASGYSWFGIKV